MNTFSVHKNRLCKIKIDYLSSTMQDVEQCSLKPRSWTIRHICCSLLIGLVFLLCQTNRVICDYFLCRRWVTGTRWHPWPRDSIQRHPSWANLTGSEVLSFIPASNCGYRWKEKVKQKAELLTHLVRILATITSLRMTYLQKKKAIYLFTYLSCSVFFVLIFYIFTVVTKSKYSYII